MAAQDVAQGLSRVPLFAELNKKDLGRLVRSGRTIKHRAGADIVTQGSAGQGFFLLLTGGADVLADDQLVARLGPGECFGESSLLTKRPRNASVRATVDVELFALSSTAFRQQIKSNPSIAIKLLEAMASRSVMVE